MSDTADTMDFQRLWKRLQQLGLNAYESRCYLVLVGHPRFKALELASRAQVPRQKIYEVLDSLAEKGFAQVVHEKTKLFSATEPKQAIRSFLERRQHLVEKQLREQTRLADELIADLDAAYLSGKEGSSNLDYLRIESEAEKGGSRYRGMIAAAAKECLEFWRPPFDIDSAVEQLIEQARERGVICRLIVEKCAQTDRLRDVLAAFLAAGVEVRQADVLPMRLAIVDGKQGMLALLDPVTTQPTWTSVVFDHLGMGDAMRSLFEMHWKQGQPFDPGPRSFSAAG